MPNRGKERGRNYTREELANVDALLAEGFSYAEIAVRKGYNRRSLMTTMSQYRRGLRQGVFEDKKRETEDWIALYEIGLTMADLCRRFNVKRSTLCMRFWRTGFDSELRQEMKA